MNLAGGRATSGIVKVFGCRPIRQANHTARGRRSENLQGTKPRVMERASAAGYGDLRLGEMSRLGGGGPARYWTVGQTRNRRFGT